MEQVHSLALPPQSDYIMLLHPPLYVGGVIGCSTSCPHFHMINFAVLIFCSVVQMYFAEMCNCLAICGQVAGFGGKICDVILFGDVLLCDI